MRSEKQRSARVKHLTGEPSMANKITDECISCGACEPECTNQAISQGDAQFEIDPAKCDECKGKPEQACKAVCPTECVVKA